MRRIWFSSDLHFCHDRQFLFGPRGFKTIGEMNEAVVERWNQSVHPDDLCFILGDLMLKDNEGGLKLINRLNGSKFIILGNHDTVTRQELYVSNVANLEGMAYAHMLNKDGYHIFLTHYPCLTGSLEASSLKHCTCNFFGHTHSCNRFFEDRPYMYNVALDAHGCAPVSFEEAVSDMKRKVEECRVML